MRRFLFLFFLSGIFLTGFMLPVSLGAEKMKPEWFYLGAPRDKTEVRVSPEGVFQPFPKSFTLTPLIEMGTQWISAVSGAPTARFEENYLPISIVTWNSPEIRLQIKSFVWEAEHQRVSFVRYNIKNKTQHSVEGTLHFILQPAPGGRVRSIAFSESSQTILVDEKYKLLLSSPPAKIGFVRHGEADLMEKIKRHEMPQLQTVQDPESLASGEWSYPFSLAKGKSVSFAAAVPFDANEEEAPVIPYKKALLDARTFWRQKLNLFQIEIQDARWTDLLRLELGGLLIARDNAGYYPREFSKQPAWTSDTLQAAETYLEYGFPEEAREDLEIVSLKMDPSGEIPARMASEADAGPLKEYQLLGRWITGVFHYYQYSQDRVWLEAKWPLIERILKRLVLLRKERLTQWYEKRPEMKRFYGLLPPSSNHTRKEYYAPRHRYEDDLWALRGWKDAQEIADLLKIKETGWMKKEETSLRRAVLDSVEKVSAEENIVFIPAAAEKPFFEPWSAALAVWQAEEKGAFAAEKMKAHFDHLEKLIEKNQAPNKKKRLLDFPVLQTFLRLGKKDRAVEGLKFQLEFFPSGDPRKASGFAQAFRDFFVYESQGKLILGAGIVPEWIGEKKKLRVKLPTEFGEIAYEMTPVKSGWRVHVKGSALPPEGFVFHSPSGSARQVFRRLPVDFEIGSGS